MANNSEHPSPAGLSQLVAAVEISQGFPKRSFVHVMGGLGDVARRFYLSTTYEVLDSLAIPTYVVCASHNPSALDFFRYHPNHRNLIIFDVGHIYMSLLHDRSVDRKQVKNTLLRLCGFVPANQLALEREPKPIGRFHAPDGIRDAKNYIVVHPFGRGWGDWPEVVATLVRESLRFVPESFRVFVICADYITADGKIKTEAFSCDLPNVTVLRNLSAPATFSLVASASRFIGNISALAQVAAFENVPSIILHPERCTDFKPPYNDYSKTIWRSNGISMSYDSNSSAALSACLKRFLSVPAERPLMREEFRQFASTPNL